MLGKLFGRLFGGASASEPAVTASEDYQGFRIEAMPRSDPNGWRVAGRVVGMANGERREAPFVRADTYPARDDATEVSLRKARQLVDEQGERLFRD